MHFGGTHGQYYFSTPGLYEAIEGLLWAYIALCCRVQPGPRLAGISGTLREAVAVARGAGNHRWQPPKASRERLAKPGRTNLPRGHAARKRRKDPNEPSIALVVFAGFPLFSLVFVGIRHWDKSDLVFL